MVKPGSVLSIAASALVLASCSHGSGSTAPASSPAAAPSAARSAAPRARAWMRQSSPSPSPVPPSANPATPVPSPSQQPAPFATPSHAPPRVVRLPPDAAPKILAVTISETTVQPGDRVSGSVVTSSNVASVEARIGNYGLSLHKVGVGRFAIVYTVAPLPWFVRGNVTLNVIAHNTRGDSVVRAIPLTVR